MSILKKAIKLGLAAKVIDLARKPENQAKAKALVGQLQAKVSGKR